MMPWLQRNTVPILVVILASAAVIGAFELIDGLTSSSPVDDIEASEELEGLASLSGLIKVAAFLLVGAGVARLIRRRTDPSD